MDRLSRRGFALCFCPVLGLGLLWCCLGSVPEDGLDLLPQELGRGDGMREG